MLSRLPNKSSNLSFKVSINPVAFFMPKNNVVMNDAFARSPKDMLPKVVFMPSHTLSSTDNKFSRILDMTPAPFSKPVNPLTAFEIAS